jgi:alpha-L-fucosidase
VQALRGFRRILDATFETDLAQRAQVTANNVRGGDLDRRFMPRNVIDNRRDTYWTSDDEVTP